MTLAVYVLRREVGLLSSWIDPIARAPLLGCMLMSLSASLMGVVVFLQKRSLLGEALSHAAYPGVVVGVLCCLLLRSDAFLLFAIAGAFCFAFAGLKIIDWLEKKKVQSDGALCFVLASFFGIGTLMASLLQGVHPVLCREIQNYLYGQVATMTDVHVFLYAGLALLVILFLTGAYRPLQAQLFDAAFCRATGMATRWPRAVVSILFLLSIVIGIRSVGVVLMSGMLLAPAVAARQFTDRLSRLFLLSALFGLASAACGASLSISLSLPTGPLIVLFGTLFALLSLLFAPKRGRVTRAMRVILFRLRCVEENILKSIWKKGALSFRDLRALHHLTAPILYWQLRKMVCEGWLVIAQGRYALSKDGSLRARQIIRLHRLWELYLATQGWESGQVHRGAEEMEHILTTDLEDRLAHRLSHPTVDPHEQPIPEKVR